MDLRIFSKEELAEVYKSFELHRQKELQKLKQFGKVKSIIHTNSGGRKFVAVHSTLYFSEHWITFPDFLFDFVFYIFGKEWLHDQSYKQEKEQHEVYRWYLKSREFSKKQTPNEKGLIQANPNGVTSAYLLFSFDLFSVLNNGFNTLDLINRLKDKIQFQGARYELFCLAACIRAGFKITLENEKDYTCKHVEFLINDPNNNLNIAVEAKSKHRSGIFGQPGEKSSDDELRVGNIARLINDAISKNSQYPLIIFLEFNLPQTYADYLIGGKSHNKIFRILNEVKKTDEGKDLFNLIVLTNHPYHYGNDDDPAPEKIHSLIYSQNPNHPIENKDLFNKLIYASLQFGTIPNNFEDL